MVDHVVVGGGHNGLVTACYLAREGLDVLVLEQSASAVSPVPPVAPQPRPVLTWHRHSAGHDRTRRRDAHVPTSFTV